MNCSVITYARVQFPKRNTELVIHWSESQIENNIEKSLNSRDSRTECYFDENF
jgi:hypothetical protein